MSKALKVENGSFMANGKKVYELESLSVHRYRVLEEMKDRLSIRRDVSRFLPTLKESYEMGNKLQIAESYKVLGNLIDSVEESIKKEGALPMLLIATLFLNVEGKEDWNWNESEAIELIEDIAKEGYDVVGFFHFAQAKMLAFSEKLNFQPGAE